MTIELEETEKYLKKNGIESPRAETEYIFCHLLNCQRIDLYASGIKLDQFQSQGLQRLIERRAKGEPLQYILGESYFYGFRFKAENGVFIPRPETEILVDAAVRKLSALDHQLSVNILDLCTGCGNIAISLTKTLPRYKIFASDISSKAIALAYENACLNGISGNIEFRCGDLFKPWEDKDKSFFDAIVCNPPYIKGQDLKVLPGDVKNEPRQALCGGEDGLDFYKKIIRGCLSYLDKKGFIFFEIDASAAKGIRRLLSENFLTQEVIKDYNNRDRVIFAQRR